MTCVHPVLASFRPKRVGGDASTAAVFASVGKYSIVFAGNSGEVPLLFAPTMIEASGDVFLQCDVRPVACDAITSFTGVAAAAAAIMAQGAAAAAEPAVMAACLIATRKASPGTLTTERISFFAAALFCKKAQSKDTTRN